MNKIVIHRTLSKRLSRTIILLAVPLFILSLGVFYQHARNMLHREAVERSFTTLKTTERLVDNYLKTIETAARSNQWVIEENFNPDSIPAITRRLVKLNGNVLSCSVATEPNSFPDYGEMYSVYTVRDGDTIITALEPEFEYFQKNWYKKTIQAESPRWINPFSDFNEGTINHHDAVGSFCMPLRPQGDRIEGVMSVDFSFRLLRETLLATHHPYPSSYYMILGPAGGYLAHPNSSLLFKKTIFTATDSVDHGDIIALGRAMTNRESGMMHVTFDNELCHVTYMPISDTGWSIALICHEEDVLADYNQLTLILLLFVVIGMVVIGWLTYKVVRGNIRPLNALMDATREVSEGNYDINIPLTKKKDVVAEMQNAFHNMQQALLTRQKEIQQNEAILNEESADLERTLPLAQKAAERKNVFIQNVWRQFTKPINVIDGLTLVFRDHLTEKRDTEKEKQSEEINNITLTLKNSAARLVRIILMLYDISDIGAANVERYAEINEVLCNDVAREAINRAETQYRVSIRLETELADDFKIKTNRLYLLRTIAELLYNAAKFSDKQHISVIITQTTNMVQFAIQDIGPGLPEDTEDLLFVPFVKTDQTTEGLGVGLPLCKRHMQELRGSLIHDKNYHEGCRFIIEIPKE